MNKIYAVLGFFAATHVATAQNIPVDFESGGFGATWTWTCFENSDNPPLEIVANPDPTGLNTSSTVAKFTARQTGNPWAGCETMHGSDIGTFNITGSNAIIRIMVWKTKISDVGIKLVTNTAASLGEIKVANTLVNQWELLTFDFSSQIGGMTYDQLVIFPDFVARPSDDIIYFDNVFGEAASLGQENLSIQTLTVFPNPTNGIIKVHGNKKIEKLNIYNLDGKLLMQTNDANTVDFTLFKNGMYILETQAGSETDRVKIIKQ